MNGFQEKQLARAENNDHLLDAWEQDFIENISDYPDTKELSERESSKLNKIDTMICQSSRRN